MKKIKVISLFDGISCGRVALERAGIAVNSYAAFETDKYAKAISRYNYPDIVQCGDVFDADFSRFSDTDIVMGGSPCTFWSIAKKNREVDKSGIGWKLFMRFAEAARTIRPRFFLYENVASMPESIRQYITEELGAEPVLINSALVSAQQRKRLYRTKQQRKRLYRTKQQRKRLYRTNITGITQSEDRGILLRDILESRLSYVDKSHCISARYGGAEIQNSLSRGQRTMVFEPAAAEKSQTFCACDDRRNCTGSAVFAPVRVGEYGSGGQGSRIYSVHGKTICLTGNGGGRGGQVGIYKIDLPDGDYIVRKLTPVEAERCQTLPDNYTAFGVDDSGKTVNISNTRRYKAAGNDRTVEIIAHILSFADWGGLISHI